MQFFKRKFGVISVIKNCFKMWELCMHLDYDHLHIPLTSKNGNFQSETNIFRGNNNPFCIEPTAVLVKISEKKYMKFSGLRSRYEKLEN